MNRGFVAALALLTGIGLGLRLPALGLRPMHNDEAVNAMKFRLLWVNNSYKYDPNEFHGPTLPYMTVPSAFLGGSRDFNQFTPATFRAVPAVFGAGLILLLLSARAGVWKNRIHLGGRADRRIAGDGFLQPRLHS